ncbi:hypothetical protein [Bradyrhizobium mercantei]|uniref:hypothetical protein n=1 Tax=Bradyrhizobium mercantei TaxID=1904807 RepID=UPI0011783B92|nr:hypothetical protein [Bradyrhizobium mercantei]
MIKKFIARTLSVVVFASLATTSFAQDTQVRIAADRNANLPAKTSTRHSNQRPLPETFRDQFALMPEDTQVAVPRNLPGAPAQPAQY